LVWALVAGASRSIVQEMNRYVAYHGVQVKGITRTVQIFFVDAGFVIDVVGVTWLAASLTLVLLASRQRISASWAWVSTICQVSIAACGAVLVAWAAYLPHVVSEEKASEQATIAERVSQFSLQVVIPVALLIWVTFLVWLLVERARLDRRGPSLHDGMRSNVFR
jgi:hypothetical protein